MKQILPILSMLFLGFGLFSQSQSTDKIIDDYIQSYVDTGDFSGCVSIKKDDSILYEKCFGYADFEREIENTAATRFRIGSISKQFTAVSLLLLEEDGLLSMQDTLGIFFPGKSLVSSISLEQLLNHTSGVVDVYDINGLDTIKSIGKIAMKIMDHQPYFSPGSNYRYSNGGYAILAHLIETISGMKYEQFLKTRIFDPLKMNNSGHQDGFDSGITSKGYNPLGYNQLKYTPIPNINFYLGSGSIMSSVDDVHIWIDGIKSSPLLAEESREKLFNNYGNNYGLGISVYSVYKRDVFGHDGRITGYIADYLHYSEDNINIVILGNIQTGVVDFFRMDLAAIIFGEEFSTKAKTSQPVIIEENDKAKMVGIYQFGPNFKVYLDIIDNKPMLKANEGSYSEIVLLKDGSYFSRMLYSSVKFKENANGEITEMIWINNDGNQFIGVKTR